VLELKFKKNYFCDRSTAVSTSSVNSWGSAAMIATYHFTSAVQREACHLFRNISCRRLRGGGQISERKNQKGWGLGDSG
jgi:hypothetical protein